MTHENVTMSTADWLEATRGTIITSYVEGWASPQLIGAEDTGSTSTGFDTVLRRVSRKRNIPVGKNLRDAVRALKLRKKELTPDAN